MLLSLSFDYFRIEYHGLGPIITMLNFRVVFRFRLKLAETFWSKSEPFSWTFSK